MKEVPLAGIELSSRGAIKFFGRLLASSLTWCASCWSLTTKLSKVYPKEIDCRQGLAEIRTRWCKEHEDLDRFGPPERNTLHLVWLFVLP